MNITLIFVLFLLTSVTSLKLINHSSYHRKNDKKKNLTQREVIPQLIFAAGCAGAVFVYAATHIDEIKEKQRVSIDAAMTTQRDNIRSAQEEQRLAIEKAQRKQQEAIRKIAEDAKKRSQ